MDNDPFQVSNKYNIFYNFFEKFGNNDTFYLLCYELQSCYPSTLFQHLNFPKHLRHFSSANLSQGVSYHEHEQARSKDENY